MSSLVLKYWNSILKIGYTETLDYRQQIRLFTLNAFAFISILLTVSFVAVFVSLQSSSAWQGLLLIPVMLLVLLLNSKRYFKLARISITCLLTLVVLTLALADRRTGTEYILIAVACSSILIFEDLKAILLSFLLALVCYIFYFWFDSTYPFVEDSSVPYALTRKAIQLTSAAAVVVQLLVFRSMINKYSSMLVEANGEIRSKNEELKASNEELHTLTEQLDWIVKQKSAELQSYLDAINIHIYSAVTDKNGTIIRVNEPLLNVTGFKQEELIGNSFRLLNAGYHQRGFFEELFTSLSEGKTWRGEVKNKRKDGSVFWIDMVIIPLKNEKGQINYYLALALPITERKTAEEEREKTTRMLEDIAFRASHKVRGPIARIQGLMNLMDDGHIQPEELGTIINFLKTSTTEVDIATRELTHFVNTHYEDKSLVTID